MTEFLLYVAIIVGGIGWCLWLLNKMEKAEEPFDVWSDD
jgi:hypothetical protein